MKTECDILAENDHPFILYLGWEPGPSWIGQDWGHRCGDSDAVPPKVYGGRLWDEDLCEHADRDLGRRHRLKSVSLRSHVVIGRGSGAQFPCISDVRCEASFGLLWESYQWCCHERCTGTCSDGDVGIKMHPAKRLKPLILAHCSIFSTWYLK